MFFTAYVTLYSISHRNYYKTTMTHVFSSILVSFSFSPTRGIFDPLIISDLGLGPVPHVLLVTSTVLNIETLSPDSEVYEP